MQTIPRINEINEIHQLTGSALRTQNPQFHCFDMADSNDLEISQLEPHRAGFYTLVLSFGTEDLNYTLNGNTFSNPTNFILCVAPGQIVKWEKQGNWFGYCTFFKSEFLQFAEQLNFLQQYPFFNINESNLIPIDETSFAGMKLLFQQILEEQNLQASFSQEIIRSHFQTILWKVRRIYEGTLERKASQKASFIIAAQFQYMVNEYFLKKTRVEDYASLLNISANHLSQTIKQATGTTAKRIINRRRLNEAQYLLQYTTNTVAEIGYHLGFAEPTHFIKFFKSETQKTPNNYRISQRAS
ncbi:MAG: AraC family transcriptional regulator [Saprospiraceae bacterium]|nr:AraC family transcriptional regulator [Saprospiraceae bacterium]